MEGRGQRGRGRGRGRGQAQAQAPAEGARSREVWTRTRVEDGETFVPPISCNYLVFPSASGPPPVLAKRKLDAATSVPAQGAAPEKKKGQSAPPPIKAAKREPGASASATAAEGAPAQKKAKKVFIYGNYDRYYGYRNKEGNLTKDARADCFKKEWFEGKRVLDIGCNTGVMTVAVAKKFAPKHILGIDVDEELIKRAQQTLERDQRRKGKYEVKLEARAKRTKFDDDGKPEERKSTEEALEEEKANREKEITTDNNSPATAPQISKEAYPFNTTYRVENFVEDACIHDHKYDAILCLSVTKWIHLNWGDEGVKTLFRKIYNLLNEGGVLILEPQEWKSYKKKARLTPEHKKNYRASKLRPEQFHSLLMDELGFKHFEVVKSGVPKKSKKAKKAKKEKDAAGEHMAVAGAPEDRPIEEQGEAKLKEKEKDEVAAGANDTAAAINSTPGFDRGIFLYRKLEIF